MATFDGWEEQLFGGYPRLGESCLAHSRTRGSKNGVRRYQTASGEWTPLGLQRRREREGWGEGRRAARAAKKAERAAARNAKRKAYEERKAQAQESKHKNNLKNMTDEELKARIARLKMEQEYKELSKSPLLKAGEAMVKTYFEAKDKRIAREEKKAQMANNWLNAKANLAKAKAQKAEARNEFISQITGTSRKKAKAELKKTKNEERKNTIRGGISASIGNIIRKVGNRTVKGMSDTTLASRGKAKVETLFEKIRDKSGEQTNDMAKRMRKERNRDNPLKG